MQTVLTAFALLLYTAFFLMLNFTLYQWVNKTLVLTKNRVVLLAFLFLFGLFFLVPGIVAQHVMPPRKFLNVLIVSVFIVGSHFFGKFAINRFKRRIPKEKHQAKAFSYIMAFHHFFWYKLNFIFFSIAQLILIWTLI